MISKRLTPRRHPAASVLVCVLACMVIVMGIVGNSLRTALQTRRHMRTQQSVRQAELVLEAGVARAARRLSQDIDYPGETWRLGDRALPGLGQATVQISVDSPDEVWPPQVTVVARLVVDPTHTITRSHTFGRQISLTPLGD